MVDGKLQTFDFASHVPIRWLAQQMGDTWVRQTGRPENRLRLGGAVGLPDISHVEDGDHDALGVAERELGSDALIARHRLAHVERHRHGPERAVRKPHLAADAIVIRTRHETAQR